MVVKTAAAPSSNKSQPNPWEALISSATRARPTRPVLTTAFSGESDDGGTSLSSSAGGGGGYTILLQHSLTPKSQRKWALDSTMAVVDKSSNNLSNNINSGTRSNKSNNTASSSRSRSGGGGDWYGSGPFLVRQALYDLSTRCNGRVVFVSVAGTTGILDLDALHDNNDVSSSSSPSSSLRLFRQNGACVDLSSNPFGWNDEDNNDEDNTNCNNNSFMTKATMTNLQSLASAIRQAVGLLRRIKAGVD